MKQDLLMSLRQGNPLSGREQIQLIIRLSLPAIMAQLSSIIMQYIDASMVGTLGADRSAAIGLISSTTWLFNGLLAAVVTGFTVQVAQRIGAGEDRSARDLMRVGFLASVGLAVVLLLIGVWLSPVLPEWLGGEGEVLVDAYRYFLIYALSLPVFQVCHTASGMLQASGNMRAPSILHIVACILDVLFNFLFIFPTRQIGSVTVWGADLGVAGAALGTLAAHVVIAFPMLYCLLIRSPLLRLRRGEKWQIKGSYIKEGVRIAWPMALQQAVTNGAQIVSTSIVAPLGNIAIAANSFAVTAESVAYMPAFGIAAAATTLIGQSMGARRADLTRKLGWLTLWFGMGLMVVVGGLLYLAAPWMMRLLSPDAQVVALGTQVLRIEAFVEPLYGASIIATGIFRGTGDTAVPSLFNFISMWAVRLPLAALLAPRVGLHGVWIAMAIELTVRGILFLIRMKGRRWHARILT
jgi:putative MATE family efflux protein